MEHMVESFLEKLEQKHFQTLKYLRVSHPRILVCFAGIPGSGKTYLCKILEEKYRALRITNDEIRTSIRELLKGFPTLSGKSEELLQMYVLRVLKKDLVNGFVLLDSGIERKYARIVDSARKKRYRLLVVKVVVREQTLLRRIHTRNPEDILHFEQEYPRIRIQNRTGKTIK